MTGEEGEEKVRAKGKKKRKRERKEHIRKQKED